MRFNDNFLRCCFLGIPLIALFTLCWLLLIGISENLQLHSTIPIDGYPGIVYGVIITATVAVILITISIMLMWSEVYFLLVIIFVSSIALLFLGIDFWRVILFFLFLLFFAGTIDYLFNKFSDFKFIGWFVGIGLAAAIIGLTLLAVEWKADRNIVWAENLFNNEIYYYYGEYVPNIHLKSTDAEDLNKHLYYYYEDCKKDNIFYELDSLPTVLCYNHNFQPNKNDDFNAYTISIGSRVNSCDTTFRRIFNLVYYSGNKKKTILTFNRFGRR